MKLYLKCWLFAFVLQVLAIIAMLVFTISGNQLLGQRIMIPFQYPVAFIDRSYPFYALGSTAFVIFIHVLNISLQALLIFGYAKYFTRKRKQRI